MTDENKDDNKNSGKWGAPTSSYDDAQIIKRFIEKAKGQKKQDSNNQNANPEQKQENEKTIIPEKFVIPY